MILTFDKKLQAAAGLLLPLGLKDRSELGKSVRYRLCKAFAFFPC